MDFICKFCGKEFKGDEAIIQYNSEIQYNSKDHVCNDCTAELFDKFYTTIRESLQKNVTPKEFEFIKNHIFYDDIIEFFEEDIF